MRTRSILMVLALMLLAGLLPAQSPFSLIQDSNLSYDEILGRATTYLDSARLANNGNVTHDEKVFGRWASFWSKRLGQGSNGNDAFEDAIYHYQRLLNGEYPICTQGGSAWRSLGPEGSIQQQPFPTNIGIVNAVAWHPTDANTYYIGCNFSGVWKTIDGGGHWQNMTDYLRLPLMPVHAITVDPVNPDIVWAGTGETTHNGVNFGLGLFKSTDAGAHWVNVWPGTVARRRPAAQANVIRLHPNFQSNHQMLIAGGKQILRSTDGGIIWTEVYNTDSQPTSPSGHSFIDLEYCPGNPSIVMASTRISNGATSGPFAGMGAQLVLSRDGGISWVCLTANVVATPPFYHFSRFAIAPSAMDNALAILFKGIRPNGMADESIVKTWDGIAFKKTKSLSWSANIDYFKMEFVISPCDTNRFYEGGLAMNYYYPAWGGWMGITFGEIHHDVRALAIRCSGGVLPDELLIGTDGGPVISIDNGETFIPKVGIGLATTDFYGFDFIHENGEIVAGSQDNGTLKLEAGQWIWRRTGDGSWSDIDDHEPHYAVGGTNRNAWAWFGNRNQFTTTTSSGGTGTGYLMVGSTGDIVESTFLERRVFSDPFRPNIFWSGDTLFVKTADMAAPGPSWATTVFTKPNADSRHHLQDIGFSLADQDVIYLAYDQPFWGQSTPNNVLFVSHDRGATFQDITANLHTGNLASGLLYNLKHVTDIEVDPEDAAHVFVGVSGYGWDSLSQEAIERVYESRDAGQTWRRMSRGLSPFPIANLCYQNGTDDVLWAATDAGVYRYDKATDRWECFNNGLPAAACTRVLIDYCRNRLLVSTYGRGMWEADLPATPDHHITHSQTWEAGTIRYFTSNVIVDPGVTLMIKGTVNFNEGKRLVVSNGAKLKLQGGTLTSACSMWAGVDVAGNVNRNQFIATDGYAPFQGIVEIIDGTIENAMTGISTSLHDTQGNYYWNSFGGIVKCTKAKFLNNRRDVEMLSYTRANMTFFRDCLFETNRALRSKAGPTTHVSMWNVRKIPFTGCTFYHVQNTGYVDVQRGCGIVAVDATYLVDWRCTSSNQSGCVGGVPTRFEGLQYGIHHECSNPLLSPSIRHSQFKWNESKGVKLRGAHFAVVDDNLFDVAQTKYAAGLYLENCTKYSVQGNSFMTTVVGAPERYGLIVHASGDDFNSVYNNSFTGLPHAISAQEDNEGPAPVDGLIMNCNDFNNCIYGIMALGNTATAGVGESQGRDVTSIPAKPINLVRNRYDRQCSMANENKFLVLHPNQYSIDHRSNSNLECQPLPQPACSDIVVDVNNSGIFLIKSQHCQRIQASGLPVIDPKIVDATSKLAQAQANLMNLIDGGNTVAKLRFVQQTSQPKLLQSGLLQHSPYLSDTVLKAMLRKVPTLPLGTLRNILLANSPLSPPVMQAVYALNLPNGTMNQITVAQTGSSARQALENDVFVARNEKAFWQDEKLRFLLRDSLTTATEESLLVALAAYPYPVRYQKQALALEGDGVAADSAMQWQQLCQPVFEQLVLQLRVASKQCSMADESKSPLMHEADLSCLPPIFSQAQLALDQAMAWRTTETHLLPPVPVQKVQDTELLYSSKTPDGIKVYPNPASDQLFVEFEGSSRISYSIRLYDIAGRLCLEQTVVPGQVNCIKLAGRAPGMYFYEVTKESQPWESGKIQLN